MSNIKWAVICVKQYDYSVVSVDLFENYKSASKFAEKDAENKLNKMNNLDYDPDYHIRYYGQYVELCWDGDPVYIWTVEATNTH